MRRTRLVSAAFAGTVCLAALAPAPAAAEPTAEVEPRRVRPGGTVTITVTCDVRDPEAEHITAYSQAFAKGEADLALRPADIGSKRGATYRGRARIASARGFSHTTTGSGSHRGKTFGINGSCPGEGDDFTTEVVVKLKPEGGAHAGVGGAQEDVNTAAVALGGALLSAAVGFGVHTLRRRRPGS